MKIERRFTSPNEDAYSSIEFTKTTSEIRNPDGTVVFHLADLEVPASWSQVASDVLAQKYFRKAGVPSDTKAVITALVSDGTPALRKYFWAKTSDATCDHDAGTSRSARWNTTVPSGLRISLVVLVNSIELYASSLGLVKRRSIFISLPHFAV